MIIDCISDLHGHYPELEGGDLLIVAGDLTATDSVEEHSNFYMWLVSQKYTRRIFIAGNHDNRLVGPWPGNTRGPFREDKTFYDFDYLCDSGTEFEWFENEDTKWGPKRLGGMEIWGSPWTRRFKGMNPDCMAFTCETEEELAEKWLTCPLDTDIMITHSPLYGILDRTATESVGSKSLKFAVQKIKPSILICGHIHECGGRIEKFQDTLIINASYVNEFYRPINKPIRIEGEKGSWTVI
jgi:Icc-related predicted phosphoesterase